MTAPKLTKAQRIGLKVLYETNGRANVHATTFHSLVRRGLIVVSPRFAFTDAGRAALKDSGGK